MKKDKIKILMLNYEYPPLGGGAGNACKYILKEFSKYKNLEIDLITSSTSTFRIEQFSKNIKIHFLDIGKNEKLHTQSNRDLLVYSRRCYKYCKELKKQKQFDLCHAFFGIPCGYIARKLNIPYIVSLRGSDVPFYNRKYKILDKLFFKRLSRKIWADSMSVIANSSGLKNLALKSVPTQKIDVISNGIDIHEFKPKKKYSKTGTLKIVSGTRLIKRKGFNYIIDAMKGLENVELNLIGEGSIKEELKTLAQKNNVKVNFLGIVKHEKINKICIQNDLCVLPSFNEGMSNFVLECMASGLPIVTSNVGGSKELISDNGFILNNIDISEIRDKIELFLEDRNLIEKMGIKSRKIAQKMSWDKVAKSYFKEYMKD